MRSIPLRWHGILFDLLFLFFQFCLGIWLAPIIEEGLIQGTNSAQPRYGFLLLIAVIAHYLGLFLKSPAYHQQMGGHTESGGLFFLGTFLFISHWILIVLTLFFVLGALQWIEWGESGALRKILTVFLVLFAALLPAIGSVAIFMGEKEDEKARWRLHPLILISADAFLAFAAFVLTSAFWSQLFSPQMGAELGQVGGWGMRIFIFLLFGFLFLFFYLPPRMMHIFQDYCYTSTWGQIFLIYLATFGWGILFGKKFPL